MAEATLKIIDTWYNEASQGSERPKLLSKLSAIELCGWLEGEFDRLIGVAQGGRLNDVAWVEKEVLGRNFGFTYSEHFRPMLAKVVGEIFVRRVEARMEQDHPGELERLKSILGVLWKVRCSFAHADMIANVAAQQTFQAPSWFLNQHRVIKKQLGKFEASLATVLAVI